MPGAGAGAGATETLWLLWLRPPKLESSHAGLRTDGKLLLIRRAGAAMFTKSEALNYNVVLRASQNTLLTNEHSRESGILFALSGTFGYCVLF